MDAEIHMGLKGFHKSLHGIKVPGRQEAGQK
jgi:hypothetical protein